MKHFRLPVQEMGFDIDGVVADTMEAFLRIAENEYGIQGLKKEHITSYWLEECLPIPEKVVEAIIEKILHDPFGISLKPIPGAVETLTEIGQGNRLTFVTARPIGEPITEWLRFQLDKVPESNIDVHATSLHAAKGKVLQRLGITCFVEDHLETCQGLASQGIKSVLFDQPWNQGRAPFVRVRSWDEIRKIIGAG